MTSSTTATLMLVITRLVLADSLVPATSRAVSTATIRIEPQSTVSDPIWNVVDNAPPNWSNRLPRYADQPFDTTAAPSASSSIRSQPMIQATNSPRVA